MSGRQSTTQEIRRHRSEVRVRVNISPADRQATIAAPAGEVSVVAVVAGESDADEESEGAIESSHRQVVSTLAGAGVISMIVLPIDPWARGLRAVQVSRPLFSPPRAWEEALMVFLDNLVMKAVVVIIYGSEIPALVVSDPRPMLLTKCFQALDCNFKLCKFYRINQTLVM